MEVKLSNNGDDEAAAGGIGGGNSDDGFMDRSKVRILLCDNDAESLKHALALLINCSYQVISVRSARQVIDALNAEGPVIDIILAEVDLPMSKGLKMLKYITRDKHLRRIPVIMMSSLDEASIVVKSLRLGAADYLVKPLRSNELLNLWTHVWRRRRLLDLAKKNIMIYDVHMVRSDLSITTTSSTTPFSDDTIDKSCNNLEIGVYSSGRVATDNPEPPVSNTTSYQVAQPWMSSHQIGQSSINLNSRNWNVGESSAFFAYVKSNIPNNNNPRESSDIHEAVQVQQHPVIIENATLPSNEQRGINEADRSHLIREPQVGVSSFHTPTHLPYPYYMPSFYPQHAHLPPMLPNPHYPCNMGLPWPSSDDMGPFSGKVKIGKVGKREAALLKFRQKRLTRCFDKKIRYLKRKDMADNKPRVKGKFARKRNGIDVDLNSRPSCSGELDDDDDVEDEDL